MLKNIIEKLPGFALAILTGLAAYFLTKGLEPIIPKGFNWGIPKHIIPLDTLVVGIVIGMIIRAIVGERPLLILGLNFAPTLFIPVGIICYGTKLRFDKLGGVPIIAWLQVVVGIICIFTVITYVGRKLKVREETSLLLAVGTGICGASAIAITTSVIKGEAEDMSLSLITITIWGLIGVFIFPLTQKVFELSMEAYALFCATALHQTGLVKSAAIQFPGAGKACQQLALSIKMVRTAMIIPIIVILAWMTSIHEPVDQAEKGSPFRNIPWFMYVFVLMGIIFSFSAINSNAGLVHFMKTLSGITFTIALTSIGLTVNIKKIAPLLIRPLLTGLTGWLAVIGVFIIGYFSGAIG